MNVSPGQSLRRIRVSYEMNVTHARMLDLPFPKVMLDNGFLLRHPIINEAISDHASRRVQVFYAQAVTYHNQGCDIWRGKTIRQHGKSNFPWSSAAHSAILPGLVDSQGLLQPGSHLYEAMNATVELPHIVNEYDQVIENVLRDRSLTLLNRVSKEGLDPYKATEIFMSQMHAFFRRSEESTREKIQILTTMANLERRIWWCERDYEKIHIEKYLSIIRHHGKLHKRYKSLARFSMHRKIGGRLPWHGSYYAAKTPHSRRLERKLLKKIQRSPLWDPKPVEELIAKQQHALIILSAQSQGTFLPPKELMEKV